VGDATHFMTSAAWRRAAGEFDQEVEAFAVAIADIDPARWTTPRAPGRWSCAALALHVCRAYEFGVSAARGEGGMRLLVSPVAAWFARSTVLPVLLALRRFPRDAPAPREVVPDAEEAVAFDQPAMVMRLRASSALALQALQDAARTTPSRRIQHAYFGPLTPRVTVRLLSAHTRHHRGGMVA